VKIGCPGHSANSPPTDIRVGADHHDELHVSLASTTRDARQLTVLPNESLLTDARGQSFRLEFRPNDFANSAVRDSQTNQYAAMLSYDVRAFGPLPSLSRYSFSDGQYMIAVAYTEEGERRFARTTFALDWRTITLFHWMFSSD